MSSHGTLHAVRGNYTFQLNHNNVFIHKYLNQQRQERNIFLHAKPLVYGVFNVHIFNRTNKNSLWLKLWLNTIWVSILFTAVIVY